MTPEEYIYSTPTFLITIVVPSLLPRALSSPVDANGHITKDSLYKLSNMPFCGRFIHYVPCVPKKQALDLDQNFPEGRWSNFSILSKDSWVQEMTIGNINIKSLKIGQQIASQNLDLEICHKTRYR